MPRGCIATLGWTSRPWQWISWCAGILCMNPRITSAYTYTAVCMTGALYGVVIKNTTLVGGRCTCSLFHTCACGWSWPLNLQRSGVAARLRNLYGQSRLLHCALKTAPPCFGLLRPSLLCRFVALPYCCDGAN